jgi:hypothetical protein
VAGALFANCGGNLKAIESALSDLKIDLSAFDFANLTEQERLQLTTRLGEYLLGAGFAHMTTTVDMNNLIANAIIASAPSATILQKLGMEISETLQNLTEEDARQYDRVIQTMQKYSLDALARTRPTEVLRMVSDLTMALVANYTAMLETLQGRPNILLRRLTPGALLAIQGLSQSLPLMTQEQLAVLSVYGIAPMRASAVANILKGNIQLAADGTMTLTDAQKQALKDLGIKSETIDNLKTVDAVARVVAEAMANTGRFTDRANAESTVRGLRALGIQIFTRAEARQAIEVFKERARMVERTLLLVRRLVEEGTFEFEAGEALLNRLGMEGSVLSTGIGLLSRINNLTDRKRDTLRDFITESYRITEEKQKKDVEDTIGEVEGIARAADADIDSVKIIRGNRVLNWVARNRSSIGAWIQSRLAEFFVRTRAKFDTFFENLADRALKTASQQTRERWLGLAQRADMFLARVLQGVALIDAFNVREWFIVGGMMGAGGTMGVFGKYAREVGTDFLKDLTAEEKTSLDNQVRENAGRRTVSDAIKQMSLHAVRRQRLARLLGVDESVILNFEATAAENKTNLDSIVERISNLSAREFKQAMAILSISTTESSLKGLKRQNGIAGKLKRYRP